MTWESGPCKPPAVTFTLSPADAEALAAAVRQITEGAQAMAAAWAEAAPRIAQAIAVAMTAPPPDPAPVDLAEVTDDYAAHLRIVARQVREL